MVFALAYGRGNGFDPKALSALLAFAGFVAMVLAPELKYPANPPAIGAPETIGARTALYFAMLAISLLAIILAATLALALSARLGSWNAALVAAAVFVAVAGSLPWRCRPSMKFQSIFRRVSCGIFAWRPSRARGLSGSARANFWRHDANLAAPRDAGPRLTTVERDDRRMLREKIASRGELISDWPPAVAGPRRPRPRASFRIAPRRRHSLQEQFPP